MATVRRSDLAHHQSSRRFSTGTEPDTVRTLFFAMVGVLLGFGCLMVYSSSVTSWPTEAERVYLSKHLVFLTIGIGCGGLAAALPATIWRRLAWPLFLGTVVLLGLCLVPGFGVKVNGATRWLALGPIRLQPSEFAKITLPLLTARFLCAATEWEASPLATRHWLLELTLPLVPTLLVVPLVFLEPDLGTAAFLVGSTILVLWCSGWRGWYFLLCGLLLLPMLGGLVSMRAYQWARIAGFLKAWSDWKAAPYQLKQSLMSFGRGGIEGVGVGKGWQKLSFLPEANTDFVFAVIGEELGLIGTLCLVILWAGVFLTGLKLIGRLPKRSYRRVVATVLLSQVVLQAAINVAVVTAMVPPKGISHPLLSAGGSSLISTLLLFGLLHSLTAEQRLVPSAERRGKV